MAAYRGPLHGIPVGVKDIINTTDMPTTGGARGVLKGIVPPVRGAVVANLKRSGRDHHREDDVDRAGELGHGGHAGNYSALFLYGMNPYDPRPDPRPGTNDGRPVLGTGGSSSGTGTTLSFWAGNVGTETSGSILSPSNANMLVGIKPTVGLISRYGIMPITADQDTAGPMTRTVTDAAIMLGAMAGFDSNDPATNRCVLPPGTITPVSCAAPVSRARVSAFHARTFTGRR